jgi:hypothetical protein
MNWNLVFIVGLGGLAVVVVGLLLRKQPVNYSFGDVGSRLFLPIGSTVGESKTEAEKKTEVGLALFKPSKDRLYRAFKGIETLTPVEIQAVLADKTAPDYAAALNKWGPRP